MNNKIYRMMLGLLAIIMMSCGTNDDAPEAEQQPASALSLRQDGQAHHFSYAGYAPLANKPITVFYHIPTMGNKATMPILFIFPGERRDAETHLKIFEDWADANHVMIFALQFGTDYYPSTTEYILGGMNTRQNADGLQPERMWNFNYVESLFDDIVTAVNGQQKTYNLWGHSAGAQYVHRFVTFMPHARIDKAVACNSRWYTVPDKEVSFPYGCKEVGEATQASLLQAFSKHLYIYSGTADTLTVGLNSTEGALQQGTNRRARAFYYYNRSKQIANDLQTAFHWSFTSVADIGHDPEGIAKTSWSVFTKEQ